MKTRRMYVNMEKKTGKFVMTGYVGYTNNIKRAQIYNSYKDANDDKIDWDEKVVPVDVTIKIVRPKNVRR